MKTKIKTKIKMGKFYYEPDKFSKMPKPEKAAATKLSWEDVYGKFLERDIDPSRIQIIKAFDRAAEYINNATFRIFFTLLVTHFQCYHINL